MQLRPVEESDIQTVARWMADQANYQWLDFGNGAHVLTPLALQVMVRRNNHFIRLYTPDTDETPIGLVALSTVNLRCRVVNLWYVLGDKRYGGKGLTTRAVERLLTEGFRNGGIAVVQAWAVAQNWPSIRVLLRNHFRLIGRQRRCHLINDRPRDRLLFDRVAEDAPLATPYAFAANA